MKRKVKKLFNKTLSVLLVACVLLGITPAALTTANAESSAVPASSAPVVVSGSFRNAAGTAITTAQRGDIIYMDINLTEAPSPGVGNIPVTVTWDTNHMVALSSDRSDSTIMPQGGSPANRTNSPVSWTLSNMPGGIMGGIQNNTTLGRMLTFEFQIANDAPIGNIPVTLSNGDNTAIQAPGVVIPVNFVSPSITVASAPEPASQVQISAAARNAAGTPITTASPGETVFIDIDLDATPGLTVLDVRTIWNAAQMTALSSVGSNNAMAPQGTAGGNMTSSPVTWMFMNLDMDTFQLYERTDTGRLVTFEFQIANNVAIGSDIAITLEAAGPAGNFAGDRFTPNFTGTTITVVGAALVNAQAPVITTHPQNRTVNVGANAGLSVVANVTDGGVLSYQWQRATGASGGTFVDIAGATSATFEPSTATAGVNRYRVVITNTLAGATGNDTAVTTSNIAIVTVNAPGNQGPGIGGGGAGGGGWGTVVTPRPSTPSTVPGVTGQPDVSAYRFTDVNSGHWFFDYVMNVYDNGLMIGTSHNEFSPNAPLTRAMIVTILWREAGAPVVGGTSQFSDVATSGTWYADAIRWAAANDVVLGFGDGNFRPGQNVTRQHLALILARYADFAGVELAAGDQANFADNALVHNYATTAVARLSAAGIIQGRPGNVFDPAGNATRAEAATMMDRFLLD